MKSEKKQGKKLSSSKKNQYDSLRTYTHTYVHTQGASSQKTGNEN